MALDLITLSDAPREALSPANHLPDPVWWEVVRSTGTYKSVPDVTAATVVDGWLFLWRNVVTVGIFRPGTWDDAFVAEPPTYKRFTYG